MKIIASTGERTYLIEATDTEIARITGHKFIDDNVPGVERVANGRWGYMHRFQLGAEVQVSPLWDWLTCARASFDKIAATAKLLQGVSEILANAPPPALVDSPADPV